MTPPRPDPDHLLAEVEELERRKRRGRLKVFLGYASGVGKSFQLLDEGRRRRERGEDVVVAATQPECSPPIQKLLEQLEVIPGSTVDVAAVIRRRPQVVLIDGLAYDNPPGSQNPKRWQDVEQILDAGITVITSVNLQYIEELRDEIAEIIGKAPSQTIPRSYLNEADDIVVVDSPALAAQATEEQKLSRLREMALLVAAEVVDRQLEVYLRAHGVRQPWAALERILVCVTPRSNAAAMISSGRRNATRFHGELYVVYVQQPNLSNKDQETLDANLALARQIGAQVEVLQESDAAEAILGYARRKGITQIFIGHSQEERAWRWLGAGMVDRLIRAAEGIDISIYPHPGAAK